MALLGAGLALVRDVIAKWCFRCRSSLLSSPKRKKSCALKVLPSSLFLGTHLPAPLLSHSLRSSFLQANHPPTPLPQAPAGSRRCSLSTSPLSAILQPMGQGTAGSGFWHPLVQAGWVRRGLGWMGTG